MGDTLIPPMEIPSPPPPSDWKYRFNPMYYGLVVVASTAILLTLYNLAVMGWCWQRRHNFMLRRPTGSSTEDSGVQSLNRELIPATTYQKEAPPPEQSSNNECAVCLSVFVDGEELRQLPHCKHLFHAACIDMWLYSHSNCPLCRASVVLPSRNLTQGEDFRQSSLDSGSFV